MTGTGLDVLVLFWALACITVDPEVFARPKGGEAVYYPIESIDAYGVCKALNEWGSQYPSLRGK